MSVNMREKSSILIEKVIKIIHNKMAAEQAAIFEQFVQQLYGSVAAEDLVGRSDTDMYAASLSLWNFIQDFDGKEQKLRVSNPEFESHGWHSKHSIIELVHQDISFIVDSLRMELNRLGITVHQMIHVPLVFKRKNKGITSVNAVSHEEKSQAAESAMLIEIDRQVSAKELNKIHQNIERVLSDVRTVVTDWKPMKAKLKAVIDEINMKSLSHLPEKELKESKDFLQWILHDHFTLMAYREFNLVRDKNGAMVVATDDDVLGIKKGVQAENDSFALAHLPKEAEEDLFSNQSLLIINKSSTVSTVHRPAHIDYIAVKKFNDSGEVIGGYRFYGLFSAAAYNLRARDIPMLSNKIEEVMKGATIAPRSHDAKALLNILETYPRDELFQIKVSQLIEQGVGILHMQERQVIRLFMRPDSFGRFFSCLVYCPREKYNTKLRLSFARILKEALGSEEEPKFTTYFSESTLARTHFTVRVPSTELVKYDAKQIELDLMESGRSWDDSLTEELISEYGSSDGRVLAMRYAEAFPPGYKEESLVHTAILDIKHLEQLSEERQISMLLYRPQEEREGHIRFKLFHYKTPTPLSDVLPMLENMGLKVIGETPYKVDPTDSETCWIMDFSMMPAGSQEKDLDSIKDKFQEAFAQVWSNAAENDGFNRLVLSAELNWRETAMLRAYAKYMWQIGFTFSQSYIEETLANYPQIARDIVKLFKAKFDPSIKRNPANVEKITAQLKGSLEQVANLDEDRILTRYLELMSATLRTNFYQKDKAGKQKSYISFKLASRKIPDIPLPAPMFEIFVYSPRVEGVHLRGGKVARGGLRWSDRREDFRTEVLGLVKSQQVKNSVIVPVGSKGGFVCKQLPTDGGRDAFMAEGISCYKIFISGLLDITDNIVDNKVIPPKHVIRLDEDDPYLVVAADKGTATFSDIANSISEEYGFWLGDAFASGGSVGYDHKKMGITARGAWESVKRHFREIGVDCQSNDFTCVGIGDMAGDVFGNGMLLSKHTLLLGAFNHMHIFIDPKPDASKSYKERKRLFELPRSSWEDYNTKLISKGGGIFSRSAKSIALSVEMQKLLSTKKKSLTPNELIQTLLKMPFDLLWNGGIGTYVKSKSESNLDVGDRANDGLRINGADLRCKIVGEGGNLGLTQLGRIEFMQKGGRANTDFIDNAGGVNCSDNEVNIKIMLNAIVNEGDMTSKQRNKLLLDMTDDVAEIVLQDNYKQCQSISITETRAAAMVKEHMRFIHALEKDGALDRALEFIPSDDEMLERRAKKQGLTRGELSVLTAYGKMVMKEDLVTPEITEDPYHQQVLVNYFPRLIREKYRKYMPNHRLKGEIIAMQIANDMVNYMGANFAFRMYDETGADPADIASCFVMSKEVFRIVDLWEQIESLDNKVPAEIQLDMMFQSQRLIRRATRWFLRHRRKNLGIADGIAYFKDDVKLLEEVIQNVIDPSEAKAIDKYADRYQEAGVPRKLARRVAYLSTMFSSLDIVEMSKLTSLDVSMVAEVYYKLGAKLELHWFLDQINAQPVDNHWQAFARASFREELDWQQRGLTIAVLHITGDSCGSAEERITMWLERNDMLLRRWMVMVADFRSSSSHEFAKFSVALRELLILVQSCIRTAASDKELTYLQ
jgi:glutamate dehydrogenase